MGTDPRVEFGMYPFPAVTWAWDAWWAAVHRRAPWTPPLLSRSGDVHAGWQDDDCIVTHVCGGPLVTHHHHDLRVIGAFSLELPEATTDARYRSVLLSPRDGAVDTFAAPTTHAAANSVDSLSGWISLRAVTVGTDRAWPGTVTFTGSHVGSVRALSSGSADVASIDAWSLAFIADEEPDLLRGLRRVASGPLVPTPAIAARAALGDDRIGELRRAIDAATNDPATGPARAALRITGFVPLDLDDYSAVRSLGPAI